MQIKLVVESEEKYNEWLAQQKTFVAEETPEAEAPVEAPAEGEATEENNETISSETGNQSASL